MGGVFIIETDAFQTFFPYGFPLGSPTQQTARNFFLSSEKNVRANSILGESMVHPDNPLKIFYL
jgi:hypothetical protein